MATYEHELEDTSDAFKKLWRDKSNKPYLTKPLLNNVDSDADNNAYDLFCAINSIGHNKNELFGPEIYLIFGLVVLWILL